MICPGTGAGATAECEHVRLLLGVLVLGALPAEDAGDVHRHLATCTDCLREYDELSGVSPLLALLSPAEAEAVGGGAGAARPGTGGFSAYRTAQFTAEARKRPRPMRRRARARARRGRSARSRVLALATGFAVLIGAVIVALSSGGDGGTATAHVVSAVDRTTGVSASVSVIPAAWGSRLSLALHNAPVGSSCSLVAVGWHGEHQVAASWTAKYRGDLTIPGAVAMSLGEIARFDIDTFDGHRLVSVPG